MLPREHGNGMSKMPQWGTVLTTKSNDMSSILGLYMVEGENRVPKIVL